MVFIVNSMCSNLVFVFPGQGSQRLGMCSDFFSSFKVASDLFEEVSEILGRDIYKLIINGSEEDILNTKNAQIALFASSMAIFKVLEFEFGESLRKQIMCAAGHSVGEYTAACAMGFLSLQDTLKILNVRSKGMARCADMHPGAMFAFLGADLNKMEALIEDVAPDYCCIANDNGNGQFVVSVEACSVDKLLKVGLKLKLRSPIKLNTAGAFHSKFMKDAQDEVLACMSGVKFFEPHCPVIFNFSAESSSDPNLAREWMVNQITSHVRWRESVELAISSGAKKFIEVGVGCVLSNLIKRISGDVNLPFSISEVNALKEFSQIMLSI